VQGEIESAIERLTGQSVRIVGAGRTDTGVHAWAQVVSFTTMSRLDCATFVRGLNAHLPDTIAVHDARDVPVTFHARFSAVARSYRYIILNQPTRSPLWRGRAWWVKPPLDAGAMASALACFEGEHDFAAFAGASHGRDRPLTTVRTVDRVEVARTGATITIEIRARSFLPHMVRNIVGTLAAVGRGDVPLGSVPALLAGRDRSRAAPTAPADGLYLIAIDYGDLLT
jgi:tRNA pseudouridine38-40 synthase